MMNLTIKGGHIYLDGMRISGTKEYKIVSPTEVKGKGLAELTIVLDVSTIQVDSSREGEKSKEEIKGITVDLPTRGIQQASK